MNKRDLFGFLKIHLLTYIMPFWTRYCIDDENGGVNNIVNDDGTVRSTDKLIWSQGRALWTFSALYRHIDRNPLYLEIADNLAALLQRTRREDGGWDFRVSADGRMMDDTRSIYVDGFVCAGLTEYALAAGQARALDTAWEIYSRVDPLLDDQDKLCTAPLLFSKGIQAHAPLMAWSHVINDLARASSSEAAQCRALELAGRIMTDHVNPRDGLLYEFVLPGGGLPDDAYGRTVVPGHAIESIWFMEEIFRDCGETKQAEQALAMIRRHLDAGWDTEYGGLYLAIHTDAGTPAWHHDDCKSWWPHCEALYALMRENEANGTDVAHDEWFAKIWTYVFSHYPNNGGLEWRHNLDRYGRIRDTIAKIPAKDPYHLPRAIIMMLRLITRAQDVQGKPPAVSQYAGKEK